MGQRLLSEGIRIDRVRRVTRRAERNPERRGEFVVVDALDETIDDLCTVLVVRIEQREGEHTSVGAPEQVGVTDLVADDPSHLVECPVIGSHRDAVPFTLRFEHDQRHKVLRPDRPFHFALIAEAYATAGELTQAFDTLSRAHRCVAETNERWIEPEIHRLQGEFELLRERACVEDAEGAFRTAITIARQQGSKMLEDRATASLGALANSGMS